MTASASAPPPVKPSGFIKWHRLVLTACLVIFAFELGLILLIFPWRDSWEMSYVPLHLPRLADIWMSRYFRGALSGLGLLNIYIALSETAKQIKSFVTRNS